MKTKKFYLIVTLLILMFSFVTLHVKAKGPVVYGYLFYDPVSDLYYCVCPVLTYGNCTCAITQ